jgi:hypothetical protein
MIGRREGEGLTDKVGIDRRYLQVGRNPASYSGSLGARFGEERRGNGEGTESIL